MCNLLTPVFTIVLHRSYLFNVSIALLLVGACTEKASRTGAPAQSRAVKQATAVEPAKAGTKARDTSVPAETNPALASCVALVKATKPESSWRGQHVDDDGETTKSKRDSKSSVPVLEEAATWRWKQAGKQLESPPDDREYGTLHLYKSNHDHVRAVHITIGSPSSDWMSSHLLCYRKDGTLLASADRMAAFGLPHGQGEFEKETTYGVDGKSPTVHTCVLRYTDENDAPSAEYGCDDPKFSLGNFTMMHMRQIDHTMFSKATSILTMLQQ